MIGKSDISRRRGIGAAATGATGGTALSVFIQALPDANPAKQYLLLSVPVLSVSLSAFSLFCFKQAKLCWLWLQNLLNERQIYKRTQKGLADGNASLEHKEHLRKTYEQFERANLERAIKRGEEIARERNDLNLPDQNAEAG